MARVLRIGARIREWGLGLALAVACGCGLPTSAPDDLTAPGTPLARVENPRAGRLAYRLEAIRAAPDGVRVELRFMNGSGTPYQALAVRVIALGPRGQRHAVRLPIGGLGPGASRFVSVRFPELGFPVADVLVELLEKV
jgi:hypothetical protein